MSLGGLRILGSSYRDRWRYNDYPKSTLRTDYGTLLEKNTLD